MDILLRVMKLHHVGIRSNAKKVIYSLVLTLLISCHVSEDREQLPAETNRMDSIKIMELRTKWKRSLYENPDSILAVANEMTAFGIKAQNSEAIYLGKNMLASYYSKMGDYHKAIELHNENMIINEDFPERHFAILNNLGNIYIKTGDFERALETHLKGLKSAEASPDLEKRTTSLLNLAGVYSHLDKKDESLDFAQKAFKLSHTANLQAVKMQSAYQIAEVYLALKNDSLALIYADSVMSVASRLKTAFGINKAREIQAKALASQGKLSIAIEVIRRSKVYYKKNNNIDQVILQSIAEASILERLGQVSQAEDVILQILPEASQRDQKEQLWKLYKLLANVQDRQGKFKISYDNYRKYKQYQDSVVSIEKNEAIERMATEYETEKKEAKIASLSQQAEIQALQIRQKNQTIIIVIVLIVLILVIIYFIVMQQNSIRRRKQIEVEQRFLRSQLNPHFISNALVAVQSSLLKNDVDSAGSYLSTFSRLMREILENSREERISIDDEISMLRDYLEIHKKRLKDQLYYTIQVEENIDTEFDTIPPMFIQPFVENAIEHGEAPTHEKMKIDITLLKENNFITVKVKDNGGGLGENNENRSLSTKIIRERIALFNQALKEKISLVIENWQDEIGEVRGVAVVLSLPLS